MHLELKVTLTIILFYCTIEGGLLKPKPTFLVKFDIFSVQFEYNIFCASRKKFRVTY